MEFNNNVCKIRVDVEKTREYYKSYLNDFCDCLYCKNYLKALPLYSQELIRLLELMGIDYTKEGESMDFGENSDGSYSYRAFYHVAGQITEGDGVWNESDDKIAF